MTPNHSFTYWNHRVTSFLDVHEMMTRKKFLLIWCQLKVELMWKRNLQNENKRWLIFGKEGKARDTFESPLLSYFHPNHFSCHRYLKLVSPMIQLTNLIGHFFLSLSLAKWLSAKKEDWKTNDISWNSFFYSQGIFWWKMFQIFGLGWKYQSFLMLQWL